MGLQILSPLAGAFPITTGFNGLVAVGPNKGKQHHALDYATPIGTPIYAVTDGIIARADARDVGGGNLIQLDNAQAGLTAIYAHLQHMYVSPGQAVHAGQIIGTTGNSGLYTTGPHLYFETRLQGTPVDPLSLINHLVNPASVNATLASAPSDTLSRMSIFDSWVGKLTWNDAISRIPIPGLRSGMQQAIDNLSLGSTIISKADYGQVAAAYDALHTGIFLPASPLGFLGDWAAAVPKILAIIGGAGMILWGGIILYNAT